LKEKKSTLQLLLIKELLEGKKISVKIFSAYHDVSLRTTQRYIEDITEVFEENLIKEGDSYFLISNDFLEKNILSFDKKELEVFVDLFSLIDSNFISRFYEDSSNILSKLQKKYSDTYMIKQNAFESIFSKKALISDIKNAIKRKNYVNINYFSNKQFIFKEAKLLKIIYTDGNFYVATLTDDEINNGFKFLRLSFITEIKVLQNTFHRDLNAEEFLKKFQTIFSNYLKKPYEVVIEVDKSIKRFFKQKDFLSSQKIVEEKENLILSYQITNDMEILPLVKKWLPLIKIISPESTKEKFKKEIELYLNEIK
jgi:predicted DNA-binding transcriptional regulator YafY